MDEFLPVSTSLEPGETGGEREREREMADRA